MEPCRFSLAISHCNVEQDVWSPGAAAAIAQHLPRNFISCTLRLVNKSTAQQFSNFTKVQLAEHVPEVAFARHFSAADSLRTFNRAQRLRLLELTARSGSLQNLKFLLTCILGYLSGVEMDQDNVHFGMLISLEDDGDNYYHKMLEDLLLTSASAGSVEVCQWLLAKACGGDRKDAAVAAARGGHVSLMRELLSQLSAHDATRDPLIMLGALAEGCSLAVLQSMCTEISPQLGLSSSSRCLLPAAAASPTPDWRLKVEWLEGQGCVPCSNAIEAVAAQCKDDFKQRLAWLRGRGYPLCAQSAYFSAAGAGNTAALGCLLDEAPIQSAACSGSVAECALADGHLGVLQLLHARGLSFDVNHALRHSISNGHLRMAQWLVDTFQVNLADRELDLTFPVYDSIKYGNLPVLRWLHERGGFQANKRMVEWAVSRGGSEEVVEWLTERGRPVQVEWQTLQHLALPLLRCLHRLGWRPESEKLEFMVDAVCQQCLSGPRLSWLCEMGCPSLQRPNRELCSKWVHEDASVAGGGGGRRWRAALRTGGSG